MSLGTLLNSDMGSLRIMVLRGWAWWIGQLEEMVPPALRSRRQSPHRLLLWDDGVLRLICRGGADGRLPGAGARVNFAVPARLAFVRPLQLPRMGSADLRRMVEMEAERLSPLPLSESIVGMALRRSGAGDGSTPVDVAILPQRTAEQAIAALDEVGLVPTGFGLLAEGEGVARFDFMPILRERSLVPARRSPAILWWSIVAFVFLLNIAVLVFRDRASVARLGEIADEQAPAVGAARAIERRANDFDSNARAVIAQRRTHDALAALALVTQALPAGAWVQRYTYDGRSVRLIGYKRKELDLIAALRADPRIAAVGSNASQIVADIPAGQPFDLSLQLGSGR